MAIPTRAARPRSTLAVSTSQIIMGKSTYRDLIVWQKAMKLSASVYRVTKSFPRDEMFGLTHQIRKAAVSVPSNIAEGRGRGSARDYRHFLLCARGSLLEVQTQALLAIDLEFLAPDIGSTLVEESEEVLRVLNGLVRYLDKRE